MLLLVSVFLGLLLLGMPVAFAIGLAGFMFILSTPNIPVSITVQRIVAQTQSFTLLAIPLFGEALTRPKIVGLVVVVVGLSILSKG